MTAHRVRVRARARLFVALCVRVCVWVSVCRARVSVCLRLCLRVAVCMCTLCAGRVVFSCSLVVCLLAPPWCCLLQLEWEKQRKEVEHRKLQQLEREEAELLERLRNTQVLQQEAMRTQANGGLP